jgi:hypothetical protein
MGGALDSSTLWTISVAIRSGAGHKKKVVAPSPEPEAAKKVGTPASSKTGAAEREYKSSQGVFRGLPART